MKSLTQASISIVLYLFVITDITASPSPAFEGRKIYQSHCMICHGIKGEGDGPLALQMHIDPQDLTSYVPMHSDSYLQRIIGGNSRGKNSKRSGHGSISKDMPVWEDVFSSQQIRNLVAYLRYLSTNKHTLPGDPQLGYSLYQKYCSICHGIDGDGNGALTKLLGIRPADHTNPRITDKIDNITLAESILDGKGKYMPAWRNILTTSEVNSLVSYIRLLYQVWSKLEDGGFVVVINLPAMETGKESAQELLGDTACGSSDNLSETGKSMAFKLGELFRSRSVPIQKVLSSSHCLALETAISAFGKAESVDFLMSSEQFTEEQIEANLKKLENRIGTYRGKGNLVIVTHKTYIDTLSFHRITSGYFLVLRPFGGSLYDEVGVYKLNY